MSSRLDPWGLRLFEVFERELGGMLQQAKRLREILNNMQRMTRQHVATSSRPQ